MEFIKKRIPESNEMLIALGMALFVVHSWSLRMFFFRVPSFLLYMGVGQILAVLAYMMAFALLESLFVTLILILVSAILPLKWLRDGLGYKSFIIILVAAVASYLIQREIESTYPGIKTLLLWAAETGTPMIALLLLAGFFKPVRKVFQFLSEQVSVMVFIYLPIGVISLVVVIFRLIF